MTRIGIVGGGRGATLHAEAARAVKGVEVIGVGGRIPGTAGRLADAIGVPDRPLDELVERAEGLVVAVPPSAVAEVVGALPPDLPLLVESPTSALEDRDQSMTAANLLHAFMVIRGLRAIAELGAPHHLQLRGRGPRPHWGLHGSPAWGGGVAIDPHATTVPVLLAAAGQPVTDVAGIAEGEPGCEYRVAFDLTLADDRRATARLDWTDDATVAAELEAASDAGVVTLRLLPTPELERNGRAVEGPDDPPLVALGFVAQMQRFVGVIRGDRTAWPPLSVGAAAAGLVDRLDGAETG